jgi:hypothetical protein
MVMERENGPNPSHDRERIRAAKQCGAEMGRYCPICMFAVLGRDKFDLKGVLRGLDLTTGCTRYLK